MHERPIAKAERKAKELLAVCNQFGGGVRCMARGLDEVHWVHKGGKYGDYACLAEPGITGPQRLLERVRQAANRQMELAVVWGPSLSFKSGTMCSAAHRRLNSRL